MDITTILSVLIGGGILAFLEFLITRHDKKTDELAGIKDSIDELRREIKQNRDERRRDNAETRRVRILRFEDELQEGKRHSKDSWDQVMSDVRNYRKYTDEDPDFENGITEPTADHIEAEYQKRLQKRDFT